MKKKLVNVKNDECIDPLRLRRLEDHCREINLILEDPFTTEQEKEEKIDVWYLKNKILVSEN